MSQWPSSHLSNAASTLVFKREQEYGRRGVIYSILKQRQQHHSEQKIDGDGDRVDS